MFWVKGFVGCKVACDGSCGFTKYIGHNRIQCYIADAKRILKAIFLAAFYRYQLMAVAGGLTQNSDIQVWDEATFHRSNVKQIPNPLGVFRIVLVSLYSLCLFWIGNHYPNTTLFQDVEHRDPILSGGFHANIQAVVFQQLVSKMVKVSVKGTETLFLIVGLQAVCGRSNNGCNQKCFVNIYTEAGWKYDFHDKTSS